MLLSITNSLPFLYINSILFIIERISNANEVTLMTLLQETFPYVMVPELKSIPISIIKKLNRIPDKYIKSLANEKFRNSLNVIHYIYYY